MKENRPWGWYRTLLKLPFLWIKILKVEEGQRTSLQSHENRAELHIALVPKRKKHRLYSGTYLEIAWGKPEEEDIVRYNDDYGRSV